MNVRYMRLATVHCDYLLRFVKNRDGNWDETFIGFHPPDNTTFNFEKRKSSRLPEGPGWAECGKDEFDNALLQAMSIISDLNKE